MIRVITLIVGNHYNWKNQPERLVYRGTKGMWHQFCRVETPNTIWCEVHPADIHMLEETKQ